MILENLTQNCYILLDGSALLPGDTLEVSDDKYDAETDTADYINRLVDTGNVSQSGYAGAFSFPRTITHNWPTDSRLPDPGDEGDVLTVVGGDWASEAP